MVSPTEEDLIKAVKTLRLQEPTLARAKVLKQLKDENGWVLSEKRLKACMDTNMLGAIAPTLDLESLKPRDAAFDDIVREAYQEITTLEREFLLGLSKSDAKPLFPIPGINAKDLPFMAASHQRHYVEILLTLKGLKPCTVIYHPQGIKIFSRLVNEVFKPVLKKHKLKSYGFDLRQIEHATMLDLGRPHADPFWRGGWFLADITSPLWPEVQALFCSPAQVSISKVDYLAYQDRVCRILGYPVNGLPRQDKFNRVCYMDETECAALAKLTGKSEDEIEVIGFEYEDDDGNEERWMKCITHFGMCQKAMKSVGSNLELDLRGHDGLFDYVHNNKR